MDNYNKVFLGKQKTVIEENEFSDNRDLIDVVIAKTVVKIGAGAFYNCTNLRSVYFEEDSQLKFIDNSVFQNCKNLEFINLPNTVVYIHAHSFWNCLKLPKEMVLPSRLEYIEETAFFNTNLEKVTLPKNCKYQSVDKGFPYEPSFPDSTLIQGGVPFDFYSHLKFPLPPLKLSNNEAKTIQHNQFSERTDLESFTIPSDIEKIDSSAFYFCKNLKNVTFEEKSHLKCIDYFAFQNCLSLSDISLPEGFLQIRAHSFWACSNLKHINFPQSIEAIDASAFFTTKLTKVILPSTCYYQAKGHGFPYESSFPENCEVVGGIPFDFYENRPFPVKPFIENTKKIIEYSSVNTDYIVPQGTVEIQSNQFSGRNDLESIIIPRSVKVIRSGAFYLCKNLKKVKFEDGSSLKSIEHYAFQNCFSLNEINFPEGLEQLRAHSFWCCSNLKNIKLPKSLKIIDVSVFYTTPIKEVYLSQSCKYQGIRHGFPHEKSFPENCIVNGGISLDLYEL